MRYARYILRTRKIINAIMRMVPRMPPIYMGISNCEFQMHMKARAHRLVRTLPHLGRLAESKGAHAWLAAKRATARTNVYGADMLA
jgi:hypothetical protein